MEIGRFGVLRGRVSVWPGLPRESQTAPAEATSLVRRRRQKTLDARLSTYSASVSTLHHRGMYSSLVRACAVFRMAARSGSHRCLVRVAHARRSVMRDGQDGNGAALGSILEAAPVLEPFHIDLQLELSGNRCRSFCYRRSQPLHAHFPTSLCWTKMQLNPDVTGMRGW